VVIGDCPVVSLLSVFETGQRKKKKPGKESASSGLEEFFGRRIYAGPEKRDREGMSP